ncbi:hypothetical protein JL720_163 [Aureococcus anophagefferens]|nr:hypothetical protein JL720_163 [Aureococcus anophagefferens]
MDLEVDSLGDAPSLEWKKSARRRSSTGSRKVPRRSVLSESTNRHNNAADDAEADSDGDLCHKTDPERGETWLARWGELVDALPAIDDGALVADKVDDLQGRYGEGWRNAGGRGDFAAAVAGLEAARGDDGDVVFDYADAAASSSTSASTARHPVLAAISAKACDVAVLVMCPEMLAEHAAWFVLAARAGIISLVVIDECDEEVGNDDSFRRSQEAQGRTIQACFALAGAKAPVVALSGTLSKFEVGSLLEALGLPPAPATLVIRTASPINSMVDIHGRSRRGPGRLRRALREPLDHVAVSPPAPVTQRPVGTAFQLELARDSWPRRWAWRKRAERAARRRERRDLGRDGTPSPAPAARPIGRRCGAETLLRRQKSALVAERDGAAAEHAHLCQEKVRVLKSSTAKMQDLKATIKQCNAALRKNQKDSNVVQARRKAAELQDRLRAATAAEPEADGAVERDPDDEIRITDGEPVFSDADDSDGDFDDAWPCGA